MIRQPLPRPGDQSSGATTGTMGAAAYRYSVETMLDRASAFAAKRYGVRPGPRKLRRWVDLVLVPGPRRFGNELPPEWRWSALSYRRILQVCRARARGFQRTSAIILDLWFKGATYPWPVVRQAAVREFHRLWRAIARSLPSGWDPRDGKELDSRSRAALLRDLGEEPPSLHGVPLDTVLEFVGAMRFGLTIRQNSVFELFSAFGLPGALIENPPHGGAAADLDLNIRAFEGLAGDPDEIETAAETMLRTANEETFTNIREFAGVAPWMYSLLPIVASIVFPEGSSDNESLRGALTNASRMLRNPHYRLLHFVIMVRRAQIKGNRGRGAAALARAVLVPLRQFVVFIVSDAETRALLDELRAHLGISPQMSLSMVVPAMVAKGSDTTARAIVWKLIRTTWRHGLSDLWRLRKPLRPRAIAQEGLQVE